MLETSLRKFSFVMSQMKYSRFKEQNKTETYRLPADSLLYAPSGNFQIPGTMIGDVKR